MNLNFVNIKRVTRIKIIVLIINHNVNEDICEKKNQNRIFFIEKKIILLRKIHRRVIKITEVSSVAFEKHFLCIEF